VIGGGNTWRKGKTKSALTFGGEEKHEIWVGGGAELKRSLKKVEALAAESVKARAESAKKAG